MAAFLQAAHICPFTVSVSLPTEIWVSSPFSEIIQENILHLLSESYYKKCL